MEDENSRGLDSGLEDSTGSDESDNAEQAMQLEDREQPPIMNKSRISSHYDNCLPSLHSYLGSELEVVRGRTMLEDVVMLYLLPPLDVVIMPGQTLPLTVFNPNTIEMLRKCIQDDRTFGVLATKSDGNAGVNRTGTTAEIFEYLPEVGNSGFLVKAKARQRFKLLSFNDFHHKARVKILPEVILSDPLNFVKLQSLNCHRTSPVNQQRFRRVDATVTHWPAFVFQQYDVTRLMSDIKQELSSSLLQVTKENEDKPQLEMSIPNDPTELSFWVAQNVPMKETYRLKILELNSPIQRLLLELCVLKQALCCSTCGNGVGLRTDMFAMSAEGLQGTYVNPGGYLHETITLYKVKHIVSEGQPSTEFSWFPGYAWTICKCRQCRQHLGWKFLATKSHLRPAKFWGLSRRSIIIDTKSNSNNYSDSLLFR